MTRAYLNLVLRHYPLRSDIQARKKIAERRQRTVRDREERGWHTQYDAVEGIQDFPWLAEDLYLWTDSSLREWMPELATRAGLDFSG